MQELVKLRLQQQNTAQQKSELDAFLHMDQMPLDVLPGGEVKSIEVASVLHEEGTEVGNMSLTSMEKSVS